MPSAPPSLSRQGSGALRTNQLLTPGGSRQSKDKGPDEEWTAKSWISSLDPVISAMAEALLIDHANGAPSELEHIRGLGKRKVSASEIRDKLVRGGLLDKLSEQLANSAVSLSEQRAATARELHDKFCQDKSAIQMSYGDLSIFHRGLEGAVGPPHTDLETGVEREHCKARDSQSAFTATNYGTLTTSEIEYNFVTEPFGEGRFEIVHANGQQYELDLEDDLSYWPCEAKLEGYPLDSKEGRMRRNARTIESYTQEMQRRNDLLAEQKVPPLQTLEFVGARLYSGPLYCKYNAVLRGHPNYASRTAHTKFMDLCLGNTYATTLHVINSAIGKLSKLTPAAKCYRGVVGTLPREFWEPNDHNVRGGVEPSFMSTTLDKSVALEYASNASHSNVFEVQMGMVDRGADLSWLSQYPHEKEILSRRCAALRCSAQKSTPHAFSSRRSSRSIYAPAPSRRCSQRCARAM